MSPIDTSNNDIWWVLITTDNYQVKAVSWCIKWNKPHPLIMKIVRSCVVHDWYTEGLGHVTMTIVCGMCDHLVWQVEVSIRLQQ